MLRFRVHMEFATHDSHEAVSVLRSLVGPVRAEPGCSATHLQMDTGDGRELTWVEEWSSVEEFERHLRTSAFRQILAVIELADAPPVVEIDDVSSRRGFELVEEILGPSRAADTKSESG